MIFIDWLSTAILHSRYVKESKSKNFVGWESESNILLPTLQPWCTSRSCARLCSPDAHDAAVHDFNFFIFEILLFIPDT